MFTGIVKDRGRIIKAISNTEGKKLFIESSKLAGDIDIDDSVSVNGVCQTVTGIEGNIFVVQVVCVTLEKTSLGDLKSGSFVNLELALRLGDRLGGHFVQGHINGTGSVVNLKKTGDNFLVEFKISPDLLRYVIEEASIAVDGVSLTVAELSRNRHIFKVSIIPHTLDKTTFVDLKQGDKVNIEVDMAAKYIEHFTKKIIGEQTKGF